MPGWDSFDAFVNEANLASTDEQRQQLVNTLLSERTVWPWINGHLATFIHSKVGTRTAAVNLDTIKGDPPFAPMTNLPGTTLWYVTLEFATDDLLDYMLAIDDPLTPLKAETDLVGRVSQHWQVDPLNPLQMQTAQLNVSVLRMPEARPFPDWAKMPAVTRGKIHTHSLGSRQLGFDARTLWVYTPPGYEQNPNADYPLLILLDGQWSTGPLQIPQIADALIKHQRLQPLLIAMIQSGTQEDRPREFIANDQQYLFMLTELLPFIQAQYRVNAAEMGVGGVGLSAAAAIHAALKDPIAFSRLIMISPPLKGRGNEENLNRYLPLFDRAEEKLPKRIFHSVGRYEMPSRFLKPARALAESLRRYRELEYRFVEVGSGHSLVSFKAVFPEALAWTFPYSPEPEPEE